MDRIYRFKKAVKHDPGIDPWLSEQQEDLGAIARRWFEVMRDCGEDVQELMYDRYPTACVTDAAFAHVGVFKSHVNVGFFRGAKLDDPASLLEGTGKSMRHVKLRPGSDVDSQALESLIRTAYADMSRRITEES